MGSITWYTPGLPGLLASFSLFISILVGIPTPLPKPLFSFFFFSFHFPGRCLQTFPSHSVIRQVKPGSMGISSRFKQR